MSVHISSRCGFCDQRFGVWQERVDHLTAHFKAGARMSEWRGDRGFDAAVAAEVTNAMPPFLIGMEMQTPNPFRATADTGCRLDNDEADYVKNDALGTTAQARESQQSEPRTAPEPVDRRSTCWEILTIRLGRFANEQIRQGNLVTDELLQSHAREIVYGSDDAWNQTAADHPEWLELFKKAHGLDGSPSCVKDFHLDVSEIQPSFQHQSAQTFDEAVPMNKPCNLFAQDDIDNYQPILPLHESNHHSQAIKSFNATFQSPHNQRCPPRPRRKLPPPRMPIKHHHAAHPYPESPMVHLRSPRHRRRGTIQSRIVAPRPLFRDSKAIDGRPARSRPERRFWREFARPPRCF